MGEILSLKKYITAYDPVPVKRDALRPAVPLDCTPMGHVLHPVRGGLVCPDGSTLRLTPTMTRVLARLMESFGEIVSADELIRYGWPDGGHRFGIQAVLTKLRHAMPSAGLSIECIQRRGYRLVPGSDWRVRK